ncbi:MAG: hypothetical protein GY854_04145 [Deltaproteobacteria bacterium]|nr:hypothetical protein [Deltaproteobacteria bacterium]
MEDVILMEWKFSPADYFEKEIRINRGNCELLFKKGIIEARIVPDSYSDKMGEEIQQEIEARLMGAQLITRKPYKLSKTSMYRLYPDGSRDITLFVESGKMTLKGGTADFVIKDKSGNIVSDSRQERIDRKQILGDLAAKNFSNNAAKSMLKSYQDSVSNPDNELVYLYEIRDALVKYFGSGKKAIRKLCLSSADWSRLGALSNNPPIKQGRHRGKSAGELRKATEEELRDVRRIANVFVEAFLVYIDKDEAGKER